MPDVYRARLAERFGISDRELAIVIDDIIAENTRSIHEATISVASTKWAKELKGIGTTTAPLKMPPLERLIPKKHVFIKKSQERGHMIKATLREALRQNLLDTLANFKATGKTPDFQKTGAITGRIHPDLVNDFRDKIQDTFQGYVEKDKLTGIPTNVNAIAITETRRTINNAKQEYAKTLVLENPEVKVTKRWIHNPHLSKVPRRGHMEMNGMEIDLFDNFHVNRYMKIKGKEVKVGVSVMDAPHDPEAPADQTIACHCDVEHFARTE